MANVNPDSVQPVNIQKAPEGVIDTVIYYVSHAVHTIAIVTLIYGVVASDTNCFCKLPKASIYNSFATNCRNVAVSHLFQTTLLGIVRRKTINVTAWERGALASLVGTDYSMSVIQNIMRDFCRIEMHIGSQLHVVPNHLTITDYRGSMAEVIRKLLNSECSSNGRNFPNAAFLSLPGASQQVGNAISNENLFKRDWLKIESEAK